MANKYANLIGTNLIKDEYTKINTGFDAVETDINTVTTDIANHETAADPHDQYALDTDLASLESALEGHELDDTAHGIGAIAQAVDNLEQEVSSHMAESTTQVIHATRDLSLEGKQTISTLPNRQIRGIIMFASISTTLATSFGMWGPNSQGSIYTRGDNGQSQSSGKALLFATGSVSTSSTSGTISNVINGSFDLDWAKVGNGATGEAQLRIFVLYHD